MISIGQTVYHVSLGRTCHEIMERIVTHEERTLLTRTNGMIPSDAASAVPTWRKNLFHQVVAAALRERQTLLDVALGQLAAQPASLAEAAARLVTTLQTGHKVLVAGNGGSAAQAQHFAAELIGRFKRERAPYAVISLNTDTAILTAVANDYGYEDVFARQIQGLGQPGDLLIAFSTSGASANLLRAATIARQRLLTVVALTGNGPSCLERQADVTVRIPLADTAIVQELHMALTHILCGITEAELTGPDLEAR
jgi:D-sedoheptulose 7-phosphate isomerase